MRKLWWMVALVVAGCSTSPRGKPPAPRDDVATACRLLDSQDLTTRSDAVRRLTPHLGVREGGSEQLMDAAGRFCASRGIKPTWLTPDLGRDDWAACLALSDGDLARRSDAMRRLRPQLGPVVGGSEQLMDAADRYCRTGKAP